jgi:hypothetical protein
MFPNKKAKIDVEEIVINENNNKNLIQNISNVIKTTFTPTGNYDEDKDRAETYAKAMKMDQANRKMAVVASTQGFPAAAKAMMDEFDGDYASMRARYG